ncbi:MAG: septal ring lytic transglycosylase RlpA family protein [Alphaproteobacteria bacterium]|nr:septal ring lytic transglycosylase RlpA family protein [Alphaproteobacteria bacterium]
MIKSFFCLIALLILAGCGGGGSGNRTNVTGVCKSCKPYFVRGSWHHPQNHYEYDEVGLASWYGPGFHGKPKPYGEIFNQDAMTAAHKTLPLPTVVRVTDIKTGKSIIVLIDDRGPFVYDGRIIDLSMGAAKALGTYQKGVVKVRVQSLVNESKALADYLAKHGNKSGRDKNGRTWLEVYHQEIEGRYGRDSFEKSSITPTESLNNKTPVLSQKSKSASPPSMDDFLQGLEKGGPGTTNAPTGTMAPAAASQTKPIAAASSSLSYISVGGDFVQRANAEKLMLQVQNSNPAQIIETIHPGGQKLYSVRLGPFMDQKNAQNALNQLAGMGQTDAIIVKN